MNLLKEACVKFLLGAVLVSLLLYLPAGTFQYPKAWLFEALLFLPMFFGGILLWRFSPSLLEKRLKAKEKQLKQKCVIDLSGAMFLAGFVAAGIDFRFGLSVVPRWLVWAAAICFLLGYLMFAEVLRENTFLSRTIEVQQGQKIIDTGLYGIVRHPMYTSTLLMFLSMPLILGSWISLGIFLLYPYLVRLRILGEEDLLKKELKGYEAYCDKVTYRLIPFIW